MVNVSGDVEQKCLKVNVVLILQILGASQCSETPCMKPFTRTMYGKYGLV